jgi:hypothetical protein
MHTKLSRIWGSDRPDDGGSKDLWNVGKLLPDYTALKPRRQPSPHTKVFVGTSEGKGPLETPGLRGGIILTLVFKKYGVRLRATFIWLWIAKNDGVLRRRYEPFCFHKKTGNCLSSWATVNFSRKLLLCGLRSTEICLCVIGLSFLLNICVSNK